MLAWKELARHYRNRYLRIVKLNRAIVEDVIAELKSMTEERKVIKELLEVIDSEWIGYCEALAHQHGADLDKKTSERFGQIIKRARAMVKEDEGTD